MNSYNHNNNQIGWGSPRLQGVTGQLRHIGAICRIAPCLRWSRKKRLKIRLCLRWKQTKSSSKAWRDFPKLCFFCIHIACFHRQLFDTKLRTDALIEGTLVFNREKNLASRRHGRFQKICFPRLNRQKAAARCGRGVQNLMQMSTFFLHFLKIILLNFTSSRYTFDNL